MIKKGQEGPVKGYICGFLYLKFFKCRIFRTLHPSKQHVFLEFLVENRAFYFSKRALRAGIARTKWLKKTLLVIPTPLPPIHAKKPPKMKKMFSSLIWYSHSYFFQIKYRPLNVTLYLLPLQHDGAISWMHGYNYLKRLNSMQFWELWGYRQVLTL